MDERRPRWRLLVWTCVGLAVASAVSNVALAPEMAGRWEQFAVVRKTLSRLLNAGVTWAGVAWVAGWCLRRPWWAVVGGVIACEATLLMHYLVLGVLNGNLGALLSTNALWFQAGLVFGAPVGLAGWLATRPGLVGVAGRLVLPAGALVEPWLLGMFSTWPEQPWPVRWSSMICGALLCAAGAVGAAFVLWRARHGESPSAARVSA